MARGVRAYAGSMNVDVQRPRPSLSGLLSGLGWFSGQYARARRRPTGLIPPFRISYERMATLWMLRAMLRAEDDREGYLT